MKADSPNFRPAAATLTLLVVVVLLDQFASEHVSLGVLYILPMLPAALFLNRWEIVFFGLVLAVVRGWIAHFPSVADSALRFLMGWVAYTATGLLVGELTLRRRIEQRHHAALTEQERLRREAEEHLNVLASSSPAAILTLDEGGRILSANESACELLGFPPPLNLKGLEIRKYLPVLANALKMDAGIQRFRTALQCTGHRESGELFVAQIWFSTYETPAGRRLAAIAVDCSEETREREEENLRRLHENNRIIAGAVSHEIRNVCGAIGLVHSNLVRNGSLGDSEDARAMASLVAGLERIAAAELQLHGSKPVGLVDIVDVLGQLRIVIEPGWQDIGGSVIWRTPPNLPQAFGDAIGLLQALLNITQNSLRAAETSSRKELVISTSVQGDRLQIAIEDSGPGISPDRQLFQPFQTGAERVGLGLFVSRAMVRSYGGDLRHEPRSGGARFVVELQLAAAPAANRVAS